jgi:uncharacterized phage protein (TIGR01671 family)
MRNMKPKFRGRSLSTGKWVYGTPVYYKNGDVSIYNDECTAVGYEATSVAKMREIVRPETIGQFVGILDKTGNEIYSGDVSKFKSGLTGVVVYENMEVEIAGDTYSVLCFCFKVGDGYAAIESTDEIAGNIYENPELISGQEAN